MAAVWAEDRYLAEDLADQVSVEWEPLDLEPPEVIFEHELAAGSVGEAMGAAARVVEGEFHLARQVPLPLETRGAIASWDAPTTQLRVWTSTQVPDIVRRGLCVALDLDEAPSMFSRLMWAAASGSRRTCFPRRSWWPRWPAASAGRSAGWRIGARTCWPAPTPTTTGCECGPGWRLIAAFRLWTWRSCRSWAPTPSIASLEPLTTSSALFAPYGLDALRVALATDLPPIDVLHVESPSPRTVLGTKGVGEAGTIGAFGAVTNAVADALTPLDSVLTKLPYTPRRVHEALNPNHDPTGQNSAAPGVVRAAQPRKGG